jgi:hypothetical protein
MKKSISSILSLTEETFISCEVTGIPLIVNFPNCGIDFYYKSPFTSSKNIKKVTSLPSQALHSLPKPVLAGIFLGQLTHLNMIENELLNILGLKLQERRFVALVSLKKMLKSIPRD